jgi:hypothetical protein
MSHGATHSEIYTIAAEQGANILAGTRSSGLPLRQATRFELERRSGSRSLLLRADEVTE